MEDGSTPWLVLGWAWTVAISFGSYRYLVEGKFDRPPLFGPLTWHTPSLFAPLYFFLSLFFMALGFMAVLTALFPLELLATNGLAVAGAGLGLVSYMWFVSQSFDLRSD